MDADSIHTGIADKSATMSYLQNDAVIHGIPEPDRSDDGDTVQDIDVADEGDITKTMSCLQNDTVTCNIRELDMSDGDTAQDSKIAVEGNIALKCQGINHVQVKTFLCSKEPSFAIMRGMALTHWTYDNSCQTWHAVDCNITTLAAGRIHCDACHREQNK